MTTHNLNVGSQLLAAILANDEPEFVRVLDAHCHQIRSADGDVGAEIDTVCAQLQARETALGLQPDGATRRMLATQLADRLMPSGEHLLAA